MIPVSRTFHGPGRHHFAGYKYMPGATGIGRPGSGGAPYITAPLPMSVPGTDMPWSGMDPSNPLTYVRPWRPAPGMIARLNFDGAQVQGDTDMGGLWGVPARRQARVGARPRRALR